MGPQWGSSKVLASNVHWLGRSQVCNCSREMPKAPAQLWVAQPHERGL